MPILTWKDRHRSYLQTTNQVSYEVLGDISLNWNVNERIMKKTDHVRRMLWSKVSKPSRNDVEWSTEWKKSWRKV